jgi:epoxide hydrolase 4
LDVALTENNTEFVEDFTLARLPGVSHWVEHDAPDRVNELIEVWSHSKGLIPVP